MNKPKLFRIVPRAWREGADQLRNLSLGDTATIDGVHYQAELSFQTGDFGQSPCAKCVFSNHKIHPELESREYGCRLISTCLGRYNVNRSHNWCIYFSCLTKGNRHHDPKQRVAKKDRNKQ